MEILISTSRDRCIQFKFSINTLMNKEDTATTNWCVRVNVTNN